MNLCPKFSRMACYSATRRATFGKQIFGYYCSRFCSEITQIVTHHLYSQMFQTDLPNISYSILIGYNLLKKFAGLANLAPVISLFGVLPETIPLTKYQCDLIAFVTLLARHVILMHWKKNISTFTFTHTHCVAQSPNSVKYGSPFCPMLTALPSSPRSSLNSCDLTSQLVLSG